jgi:phosphoribosylamine--glycine ligase
MTVCVIGAGAREHALCSAIARSDDVIATPGNPGIEGLSREGHRLSRTSAPAEEIEADLFVVGPEVPLVDGLADRLRAQHKLVLGPPQAGARLEGSKAFMKALVQAAKVPTADFHVFDDRAAALSYLRSAPSPYVIKTDGLAAGKGVLVTADLAEAERDVTDKLSGSSFGEAGRRVVIEDPLFGQEVSLLVLADGRRAVALPPAQDFKRARDGDAGPNTGGMGAYSPVPAAGAAVIGTIMDEIIEPTLAELARQGIDYRGVLYAGCMLTEEGPKLIEFNVRFGDPEAQVILPRLDGDVVALFAQAASGHLVDPVKVLSDVAVTVVLAASGYPEAPVLGDPIHGLREAGTVEGVQIFHAGTARDADGVLRTAGGRVLSVTALGEDLHRARARAYEAVDRIEFAGMQFRSDIAEQAAGR